MKLVVGISGASGAHLGIKFLSAIDDLVQKYCVFTNGAKCVLENENGAESLKALSNIKNLEILDDGDLSANISSGSFGVDAMAVLPCSQNTLAKISVGICDTLLTRSASVMIKEQRKLLLSPREMPFSAIVLENMLKLSRLGVVIAPPILGYYAGDNLDDIERFIIGKWCDALGIPSDYNRWNPSIIN
ncbi:MAG: UbiX family flavin prenyltransferase [Helicobacter sp.]|nr:UbiX family flavin prenyltransferase [Helicobacter sp.]